MTFNTSGETLPNQGEEKKTLKQVEGEVIFNTEVMPGVNMMWLYAPEVARAAHPGQFVLARCGPGFEPLLRRPLSIHRTGTLEDIPGQGANPSSGRSSKRPSHLALLVSSFGLGMSLLTQRKVGDKVDIIGPLGRGFSIHRDSRNFLLVGAAWGIAPLVALAQKALEMGKEVTLLMGSPTNSQVYPADMLPQEIEVLVATEDGSLGRKGFVTDVLPEVWAWSDEVFASGPVPMYRALANVTAGLWPPKPIQVLMDVPMACGVGACYGCAFETKRGMKRACLDGPRFYLKDLVF